MKGRWLKRVASTALIFGLFLSFPSEDAFAAEADAGEVSVSVTITPLEAPPSPSIPAGELPMTGLPSLVPMAAGLVAILAGSVLVNCRSCSWMRRVRPAGGQCSRER